MSEFSELYGDEFFIIDSNNFNSVESRLYGFSILNNNVVQNEDVDDNTELLGFGSYVHIKNLKDKISIHQDLNGCWGLYIYRNGNYFAISNSFFKLVEYLKDRFKLTLNKDFAKALMSTGIVTLIFRKTLVQEIDTISRNYIVTIDKNTGDLSFSKTNYKMHTVPLNSIEALDILDNWFNRWVNILRSLKEKTNNIEFNLSGGFDTRIIIILMLCANIDLNKIKVRTYEDLRTKVHKEDYEIACDIANEFGFKLNNNVFSAKKIYFNDINTIIDSTFYVKGGFHNQLDYRFYRTDEPVYNFSGAAAEMMRTDSLYYDKSFDEILDYYLNLVSMVDSSFVPSVKNILLESLNDLSLEFNIEDKKSKDLFDLTFTETRCRNHFGKFGVAEYFTNKIFFTPVVDPELHKLKITTEDCDDKYLLYTLIFVRYCPKLLNFKVEGGRKFNENTIEYAKKINRLKSFVSKDLDYISGPDLNNGGADLGKGFVWDDVDNHLMEVFRTDLFKNEFIKVFPETIYHNLFNIVKNTVYFPLGSVYPVFHVLKIVDSIKNKHDYTFSQWLDSFIKKSHSHSMSDIIGIDDSPHVKSADFGVFNKNQIKLLQKLLSGDYLFKLIDFNISNNYVQDENIVKFSNICILDFNDELVDINPHYLNIIINDSDILLASLLNYQNDDIFGSIDLPTSNLKKGINTVCLKYRETYSDDISIYVKDSDNLFDLNVWSGSDYGNDDAGFDSFQVKSISSSGDWAEIGEKSIKVECDGSYNYQALTLPGQDVNVGDLITSSVTVYNPNGNVVVRLYESSVNSFNSIEVSKSNRPSKVNINKIAKSNRMQLLIYARDEQIFYADNFVFKKQTI